MSESGLQIPFCWALAQADTKIPEQLQTTSRAPSNQYCTSDAFYFSNRRIETTQLLRILTSRYERGALRYAAQQLPSTMGRSSLGNFALLFVPYLSLDLSLQLVS